MGLWVATQGPLLVSHQGTALQLFILPSPLLFSSCLLKASLFAFPWALGPSVGLLGQARGHQTALRCLLPRPCISVCPLVRPGALDVVRPRALGVPLGGQAAPFACLGVPTRALRPPCSQPLYPVFPSRLAGVASQPVLYRRKVGDVRGTNGGWGGGAGRGAACGGRPRRRRGPEARGGFSLFFLIFSILCFGQFL